MELFIAALTQYAPILPEAVLVLGAMCLLLFGVMRGESSAQGINHAAVLIMLFAGFLVLRQAEGAQSLFEGRFLIDEFTRFMKLLALIGAAATLAMSFHHMREAGYQTSEFAVLVLFATTGMMLMISAGGLISLYLGLEMQSLSLYVIAAIRRDSLRASEAGLKYFILGALSSGMLLYGASLVYGMTGGTTFAHISTVIESSGTSIGLIFGLVFLLAGLAFKISAVPFHMWTPDVYEGAPTPVTAFFAAAPKIAAMALLVRVTVGGFMAVKPQWQQIIVFIAIASMFWGAFAAIGQTNIKRLMAYSSIGHMGFALVGLAAGNGEGVQAVLIYLAIYLAMTLGAFACILSMRRADGMVEDIDQLSGLAQNNLLMAFVLAMLLFSLAGIPPLAGFFAKFYVFLAAVKAGLYPLAVLGVLASVVGAYYYIRIIKIMFLDDPVEAFEPMTSTLTVILALSGLFVLFYVVYPAPLVEAAEFAAKTFF